jgi:hypothetical protein
MDGRALVVGGLGWSALMVDAGRYIEEGCEFPRVASRLAM